MSGAVLANASVFDGQRLLPGHAVRIDGERIAAVGPTARVVADAPGLPVADLGGDTLLPGLVNMHVHLGLSLPGDLQAAAQDAGDADLALAMAGSAQRTLHAGVTTVRLVGERRFADIALRSAIEAGNAVGPRIFTACHALCCTGGHGWDADAQEADGPEGFRRATREQLRAGADLVKVCISGGIAGQHEHLDTPQLTDAELAAVIDTAHDWGRKVAAHAGPDGATRRAVALGLDCVEHGYELSAELTQEMARRGVSYVPTISVSRCTEFYARHGVPPWMVERALSAGPRHWESLQHAIAAGVDVMLGTDLPPAEEYDGTSATVRELEFMVEAGMSPLAALLSATSGGPAWLGAADLGVVRPGAYADLVVVAGDPTTDVSALRSLHTVVKNGRAVRDDRRVLPAW